MTTSRINIALIGLGDIAQKAYLPILANHPRVNPMLCTRDSAVLQQLAKQYRISETYRSVEELLHTKVDAAMVHSATSSHAPIVTQLLNAGIPVFVDKPLTYSFAESEKLLHLATQKNLLVYLGFNRRFAPLIHSLQEHDPRHIMWQKNRVNLAVDPRVFIFDDFIHVVDSLRFLGKGEVNNLQVFSRLSDGLLESLQIQWEHKDTLLSGIMNRCSGTTEERVEYYSADNKWLIDELSSGWHYERGNKKVLRFDNWKSTLYKRGFVAMIDDWLRVLEKGEFDAARMEDIWKTHHLCETILTKVTT